MQRILVTGGAGFIGSNFVHHLLAHTDATVTVLDKLTYAASRESLDGLPGRPGLAGGRRRRRRPRSWTSWWPTHDAVVHFAAESHNDNSLTEPGPFIQTNLVGTFQHPGGLPPPRRPAAPHLHRRGVRRPRARRPEAVHRGHAVQPEQPLLRGQGGLGPPGAGVGAQLRRAGHDHNCSNNYGPWQHIEKFIPRQITNVIDGGRPRSTARPQRARLDPRRRPLRGGVADPRAGPDRRDLPVGADGERNNLDVVAADPRALRPPRRRLSTWSPTAPATTCATPSTRASCAASSAGGRAYPDFEAGLARTIEWYREHEDWWRPHKEATEAAYAAKGQ